MSAVAPSSAATRKPAIPRNRLRRFLTSSVGLKVVMALTGLALSLFVLLHMLGNLQAFQGAEALNDYAKLLRKEPALLWTARVGLLATIALHVYAFVALARRNAAARPIAYGHKRAWRESTYASRTMRITGPLLLLFIVYHLLHLTKGAVHPDFVEGDVYHNVVTGLGGVVGAVYIVAMTLLAFHLWHGIWSMMGTLGFREGRYGSAGRHAATAFATLVAVGFALVPLMVMLGVVAPEGPPPAAETAAVAASQPE